MNPGNSIVLSPNEEVSNAINLSEHFVFNNRSETYTITARYQSYGYSLDDKETWEGIVYSNTITISSL